MNKLTELRKLDKVLHFLSAPEFEPALPVADIVKKVKLLFETDDTEVIAILRKLEKDEYLSSFKSPMTYHLKIGISYTKELTYYIITFEGKYFIKSGGYVGREKSQRSENNRLKKLEIFQISSQKNINILTFVIAVGTGIAALYYFIEIYKELHLFFHRHNLFWVWEEIPKK